MKLPIRRLLDVLAIAIAGLVASGCATTEDESVLEANLVNLRFTQATMFETVAVAEVRLTNLGSEDLEVTGASHQVVVNGANLGRGVSSERLTVPRLSSSVQQVEFHLRNLSFARTLPELSRTRVLDYSIHGTVYARAVGGHERRVKVHRDGQLDLNQFAPAPPSNGAR